MNLQLGDTRLIIAECLKRGATLQQAAYILATARWETAHTMKPVEEAFWLSDAWRAKNLRYYPWHGRGYVQLTWERNYLFAGKKLDRDLTTDPDAVMNPVVAAEILVLGSLDGWFTSHNLRQHVNDTKVNYWQARRVINGTDKAQEIAGIAVQYEVALQADGYGTKPATNPAIGGMFAAILAWIKGFLK